MLDKCLCADCVDFRLVQRARQTGEKCFLVELFHGFLKYMCIEFKKNEILQYYKCAHSNTYYQLYTPASSVSKLCENDPHVYQACGLPLASRITNSEVVCGGHFCKARQNSGTVSQDFAECWGQSCRAERRSSNCRMLTNQKVKLCDDVCDAPYFCEDESYCNNYKYGVDCSLPGSSRPNEDGFFRQGYRLCGGVSKCHEFSEVLSCTTPNSSDITCDQYTMKVSHNQTLALPILNYTRCLVLDGSVKSSPFCLNYLDQTNCSDIARVGGYCKVNGFLASVSKYMVCNDYDYRSNMTMTMISKIDV